MHWYRSLTTAQRRILASMAVALVAVVGLLGWSVWSTLQAPATLSPVQSPLADDSVLPTPTAFHTPTVTPTPTPTATPQFDLSRAGIVAGQVADARQSASRWGTPLTIVDDAAMAQAIYGHYRRWEPLVLRHQILFEALHLWSWDSLRLDAVGQGEQTAAFYAPEVEELYLRQDWTGPLDQLETQLAYGYARPLPDQYGDLVKLVEEAPSLDRRLAVTAVAEGDALVSALLTRGIEPGGPGSRSVTDVVLRAVCPKWQIEDSLLDTLSCLSFRLGADFAIRRYLDGGIEALDETVLRPPRSTAQLLDPERYVDFHEPQVLVPLDVGLGQDWVLTATETLGQALLRIVLTTWSDGAAEDDAITGWEGDLLQVWQGPEESSLVVWQTEWDEAMTAARFYGTMIELLPRPLVRGLIRDKTAAPALPRGRWWSGRQGAVFLYRRSHSVWVIWSDDAAAVESAAIGIP